MITQSYVMEINKLLDAVIHSIQCDTKTRYIQIHLVHNGNAVDLTNCEVQLHGLKPDDNFIINDAEILDHEKGLVQFEITDQINAASGDAKFELRIYGTNDNVLTTKTFVIRVQKSTLDKIVDSSSEFHALLKRFALKSEVDDKIAVLEEQVAELDNVLNPLNISLSINPSTAERGSTVSTINFSWSYTRNIRSQTFNGEQLEPSVRSKTYTGTVTANKTFTLSAVSTTGQTKSQNASITFLNGVYYGASSKTTYDSAFVLSLTKTLSDSRSRTITVTAGAEDYIYYCVPSRLGNCTFSVGGFTGGFSKVTTISVTNTHGYSENYDIWKSDNKGLGTTKITIS